MIIEECQAVHFRFLILEMDEGRSSFGEDFQSVYILLHLFFLFPQIKNVLSISSSQDHLQLFLFQLLLDFVQLLEVGKLVFISADQRNFIIRAKWWEKLLQLALIHVALFQPFYFKAKLLWLDLRVIFLNLGDGWKEMFFPDQV